MIFLDKQVAKREEEGPLATAAVVPCTVNLSMYIRYSEERYQRPIISLCTYLQRVYVYSYCLRARMTHG